MRTNFVVAVITGLVSFSSVFPLSANCDSISRRVDAVVAELEAAIPNTPPETASYFRKEGAEAGTSARFEMLEAHPLFRAFWARIALGQMKRSRELFLTGQGQGMTREAFEYLYQSGTFAVSFVAFLDDDKYQRRGLVQNEPKIRFGLVSFQLFTSDEVKCLAAPME